MSTDSPPALDTLRPNLTIRIPGPPASGAEMQPSACPAAQRRRKERGYQPLSKLMNFLYVTQRGSNPRNSPLTHPNTLTPTDFSGVNEISRLHSALTSLTRFTTQMAQDYTILNTPAQNWTRLAESFVRSEKNSSRGGPV